ncbi:murein biosynthesis integral membrane protein MurJ [Candidatus Microgenomates bacterium]|nr:MAG: murein biosynthesis integral membrane protein MurJ [Candidatus Microgenomates bacterium]
MAQFRNTLGSFFNAPCFCKKNHGIMFGVRNVIVRLSSIITRKQNSILSAASVIMIMVLLSRVLGLLRDRLLAHYFSVSDLGIYFAAFRLPNLIFELLVMGALATAFIPVFTRILTKEGEQAAFKMAANIINVAFVAVVILIIPLLIFTYPIARLIVPGFNPEQLDLMVSFTRIMLLGQLLPLAIGNFFTGMLQSFQRFLLPALAPVVYNIGIILGVVFFASATGLYSAVFGVVIGAFMYLLIQIPLLLLLRYRHTWQVSYADPHTREVFKLMLPRTFGLAVSQIDTTLDLILASFLGPRSITIFNFAQHLQQVPIGLFGATFAQAVLPTLSSEGAKKDLDTFKKYFLASLHQTLFFVLPASMMLIVLRIPVVRLVFGAERFDWEATVLTGMTVSFFAVSIFAQSLAQLLARAFYALLDTKTPVIIGVVSVIVNVVLSYTFILILHLPVWSLAASASSASIVHIFFLWIFLYRKVKGFDLGTMLIPAVKILIATLITGIFLYVPIKLLDRLVFDTTRVFDLILLTGVASFSGLSVYVFLAWFLDIAEVTILFKLLHKVRRMPRVFFSSSSEVINGDQTQLS